ncbi:sirohydrochlorin chelatase [Georgenia halophila]
MLACSHGTSSPAGRAAISRLVAAVSERRPDVRVEASFVDVQEPDVPTSLAGLGERDVRVVPLLLSAGYHVHVDLARAAREAPAAEVTAALGPDMRLAAVLARRLADSGLRRGDRVVLGCAGSSDGRAVEDCEETARLLAALLGRPVSCGYISAASPRLADAVAQARTETADDARVVVATYLLAPGYFADLAAGCGADVVTEPLLTAEGEPPAELIELVLERFGA